MLLLLHVMCASWRRCQNWSEQRGFGSTRHDLLRKPKVRIRLRVWEACFRSI